MEPLRDILFKELKKRNVSVYEFAKLTGIKKERIYKWRQGEGHPKLADADLIRRWMGEEVTTSRVSEAEPVKPYGDYQQKYIGLLERNNRTFENSWLVSLGSLMEMQQTLRALSVTQLNQLARLRAKAEREADCKSAGRNKQRD
jgi:transcriptional regulator with XRE-family HTH domain